MNPFLSCLNLFVFWFLLQSSTGQSGSRTNVNPDSTLLGLKPMAGAWGIPPSSPIVAKQPELRQHVVHDYAWTVNGKAVRIRENYRRGHPEGSEVDGLVYWNPATERIEFAAVGGGGEGQGRFFAGEYRILADGAIERIYDVFYRTLADTPGEDLGGGRRRYREVYRFATADSLSATLDWWRDGRWQPFGPGTYSLVRFTP